MFKVVVAKTAQKKEIIMDENNTVRDAWNDAFGEYVGEMLYINGRSVENVDSSFGSIGLDVNEVVYITCLAKVDAA
ncbi:MAG: hypothetical protein RRZ64_06520 [Rikenellaceae bacterium]